MTGQIAFLITPGSEQNDNHERLPRYFAEAGWRVDAFAHDALNLRTGEVFLDAFPATTFDRIWPVGFGPRAGFLDRAALLRQVPQPRLVTPVDVWLSHHGKSVYPEYAAPSVISASAEVLCGALATTFNGDAVLKPLAGSFGRNVQRVTEAEQIQTAMNEAPGYWMLQAFVAAIEHGETRTLVCGASVLGSYLRLPQDGLHANLALAAEPAATSLTGTAAQRVAEIHGDLCRLGVGFAAIDTVGETLMEVNVANPGGLATLEMLYGKDLGPAVCQAITQGASAPRPHRGTESTP